MLGPVARHRRLGALGLLAGLLTLAPAGAEIYKSVDENGNVVFSEKPPAGTASEVITPRYARPPSAAAQSGVAAGSADADAGSASGVPPEAAAPAELTAEQQAAKAANCENARGQLERLNAPRANRLQYLNEKKELAFYSEEQRAGLIKEAEAAVQEYCN